MMKSFCYLILLEVLLTVTGTKSQSDYEIDIQNDCESSPPPGAMSDCCTQNLEGDPYHYQKCFLEWSKIYGSSNGYLKGAGEQGGPAGCTAECALNSTGIYHEYKLDKTAFMNLKIVPEDSAFYNVTKAAVDHCVDEANKRSQALTDIQNSFDVIAGQRNCNPISGFALTCINVYIFRHCPEWQNSPGCPELKSYYDDCPYNHY